MKKLFFAALFVLTGCAATPAGSVPAKAGDDVLLLNRLSWGANGTDYRRMEAQGLQAWLESQLNPPATEDLPAGPAEQVAAMRISREPLATLGRELLQERKAFLAIQDPEARKDAQQAFQKELNGLARETAERSILRDLYSPWQLREQMTWFWMNHFNVFAGKGEVRVFLADYEDTIRAHSLGRFRDLLGAVAHHPAMMRYLDNAQNKAGHLNENYARELMELHTLGVDAGYTQADVQEMARVLTGFALLQFRPRQHDFGPKTLLGEPIRARGEGELEEALDRLARHPATARFISRKLALYFVSDHPSAELVQSLADEYQRTDGRISDVLKVLFSSSEFKSSLGKKFKDPVHYAISAVRLAYDGKPVLNPDPILYALNRMGEQLYGRQTPDGYPLTRDAWASAGQMETRFELARMLGYGPAGLFKTSADASPLPAFPRLANGFYYEALQGSLGQATRKALDQASSPQEWNLLYLSSPEFMLR